MKISDVCNLFKDEEEIQYFDPFKSCARLPTYEIGKNSFRTNPKAEFGGFKCSELSKIEDFLDCMHPDDLDNYLKVIFNGLQYFNENFSIKPGNCSGDIVFRVIGKGRKLHYYHRKSIVNGCSIKGKLAYNYTYLNDVTWMRPSIIGNYVVRVDNKKLFESLVEEVNFFRKVLTPKEVEILKLLSRGFQSSDIGVCLRISKHTVNNHRRNMLHKLEVANTPELLTLARDMNLF